MGGLILVYMGLTIEPQGEIHPSVLVAYGETLTFAGAVVGVDYHYRAKQNINNHLNPSNNEQQIRNSDGRQDEERSECGSSSAALSRSNPRRSRRKQEKQEYPDPRHL